MPSTIDAILDCSQGKHGLCDKFSLQCRPEKRWKQDINITPKSTDLIQLRHCIKYRLGPEVLSKTYLGYSTQKAESCNRALHRSLGSAHK